MKLLQLRVVTKKILKNILLVGFLIYYKENVVEENKIHKIFMGNL